jgi:two-component system alkaline phosphatase synthesis response regulator PhoP
MVNPSMDASATAPTTTRNRSMSVIPLYRNWAVRIRQRWVRLWGTQARGLGKSLRRYLSVLPIFGYNMRQSRAVDQLLLGKREKEMASKQTILMVDDQMSVRTLVQDYLTQEGYRVVVASNGKEALYAARHEKPDLILLDIMMPEMGGYDFIRAHRQECNTPIILLTAKLDETDKVLGLELGADDYVTKPFGMRELVARVHAVLRRTGRQDVQVDVLRVGAIVLDRSAMTVTVDDAPVHLTPSEFKLLETLMTYPGRAFSRLDLLEALQGVALQGAESTINIHIRNLRAKIEPDPKHPSYIETVFGVGYRLCSD